MNDRDKEEAVQIIKDLRAENERLRAALDSLGPEHDRIASRVHELILTLEDVDARLFKGEPTSVIRPRIHAVIPYLTEGGES